jgi:hypothetical protein
MKNSNGETVSAKEKAKEVLSICINGQSFSNILETESESLTEKQKVKVMEQIDKIKIRLNKIVGKK